MEKQCSCLGCVISSGIHLDTDIVISEFYIKVMVHTFLIFISTLANLR